MTGWGLTDDKGLTISTAPAGAAPGAVTLAEIAEAAQREQLLQLVAALRAHRDLAAQVHAMLRSAS